MTKTKKYSFSKAKDNNLSLDFHNYNYWESVDEILELLNATFEIRLIKELDGPATRYKRIEIEGVFLNLYYTSYGAFLNAEDENGNEILKNIKEKLEESG